MIGIAFSLISEENIHISLKYNICILSFRVKWAPKEIKDHLDFMAKREVLSQNKVSILNFQCNENRKLEFGPSPPL